ncbi:MAG: hypothetical protein U0132_02735 [Gemmatimonadaceae bacterium]
MTSIRWDDHDRVIRVAVCAVVLLAAVLTVTPWPVGAFQDDAIYTVLAKSLATGHGYRLLNLPGEPNATHYPPGYPMVLALLWRLWPSFPDNIVLFKFANAAFLSAAALAMYAFVRRRLSWGVPAAAGLAVAGTASIVVLLITGVVLSEPLFMALLIGALLYTEDVVDRPTAMRAFAAGIALGTLALVRTIGVAALPAAVLALLVRGRWRSLAPLVGGALCCLLPWQWWVAAHASEVAPVLTGKFGAYTPWLADGYRAGGIPFLRQVLTANLQSLDGMFSFAFMPVAAVAPRGAAFVAVVLLGLAGTVMLVRSAPVTAGFLAAYVAISLVWPFEPTRFFLAIWPLVLLAMALPVRRLWQWRPPAATPRALRGIGLAGAAALLIGFGTYNVRGFRDQWWTSIQRDAGQRAKPIAEWIARNTHPGDVLATEDDLIVYLYTGRQALPTSTFLATERVRPLSDQEDLAAVRAILASYRPRFFITASKQGIQSATALTKLDPPELRPYAGMPNALIFERVDTPPSR